ncbi:PREDICTED: coiled-coil domain-containing protein 137 [Galeopterus variegatus]|uniref:Coiled-coil domain-containing protein 137 n=1 Tax=Galeopterus variegatus TaxID=482537 RepID=A0ABM0QFC2_GALVR|nr:PREDICTED: coiled-coil domain-containing protein 137 [Galeopterus variegatus]
MLRGDRLDGGGGFLRPDPASVSLRLSLLYLGWVSPLCSLPSKEKKVNCKPKNQDEQEIPFRLREIMRSRQEMKNPISNKKRKKEAQVAFRQTLEKEAKGEEPDIAIPKFKQGKWESDGAYIQRMEQEAQHVLFLSKNQASRQPEAQAAAKKEKSERKKAFQKRRLDKVRQKKEAKAAERLEQELLRDTVKFGEVVLQPPELTAKPRRSTSRDQPAKKSLTLRTLLSPVGVSQPLATSLARQRIMGEERERAVQAYRVLKRLRQRRQVALARHDGQRPGAWPVLLGN